LAYDFAPDLLTLQQSPPARLPRVVTLGVVALVGAMVVWGSLARLDIVASAQGRLVPQSFTKVVQPSEPGIVSAILVKEGEQVRAGQVLMRLDARLSGTDVQAGARDVALKRLTLQRIEAELADAPLNLTVDGKVATPSTNTVANGDLIAQVMTQYQARRKKRRA
jgi:HlyD family secretion protein